MIILVASVAVYFSIRLFLVTIDKSLILFLLSTFPLTLLLSLVSIQLLPIMNGNRDYIHAVKMGYPIFWIVLLLPFAVSRALKISKLKFHGHDLSRQGIKK